MAKEKGSGSKGKGGVNLDEVVASNKKVLEQLNEISNQSAGFFNVAREAALKFIDTAEEVTSVLSEQCEKVKCFEVMSKSLEEAAASSKKFSNAISQQAINTKKFAEAAGFKKSGTGYANKHNVIEEISESSKRAKVGIIGLSGALKLLGSGFSLIKGIVSGLFSVIGKLFGLITGAVKGIFNFVNGLYETMFDMANDYVQLLQQLDRERENIRESFGDTSKGVGKAVVDMGNQLWSAGAAGLSGMQLFESAVEAMQAGHEIAKAGGAAYEKIVDQFSGKGINNVYGFAKGLGITNEEVGKMMGISVTTGRTLEGMFTEVEKFARGMNNTFGKTGGSFKSVSRDIIKARLDVKHFANVAIKDLAVAAQSARSLGVELDKITGIMDAFDNFDTAAENVSKLSQAFGVNLDTMQLMKANTPTEQLDILKKSFAAAGKSIQDLDKRSLNYLATTLHLDAAVLQQAGSSKNQGVAMDDLKAKSASIEQQMVSTTDALKDVMKDIKLYIRDLTNSTKGFFATFMEGFTEGIVQSGHFQKTMMTMADAIRHVKMAGREAGKAFVEYFPGVKDMLNGLVQILPKIGQLFEKYSRSISKFFKDLQDGVSVGSLFGKLKKDTQQFFQDAGPGGSLFVTGARNFLSTVGRIFQEAVAYLIKSMTDMLEVALTKLANWLSEEPKNEMIKRGEAKPGSALDFGGAILKSVKKSPIGQAFEDMGKRLGPIIERIINLLGEKIKTYFEKHKAGIAQAIGGMLILAIGSMLFNALPTMLLRAVPKIISALKGSGVAATEAATGAGVKATVKQGVTGLAKKGLSQLKNSEIKSVTAGLARGEADALKILGKKSAAALENHYSTVFEEGLSKGLTKKQAVRAAQKSAENFAKSKAVDQTVKKASTEIAKKASVGIAENIGSKLLTPKMMGIGTVASIGLSIGAEFAYEAGHGKLGAAMELSGNVMGDAITGAMIGSVIPGIGNVVGAAAGAAVGLARTAFGSDRFQKEVGLTSGPVEKSTEKLISESELFTKYESMFDAYYEGDEKAKKGALLSVMKQAQESDKELLDLIANDMVVFEGELDEAFSNAAASTVSIGSQAAKMSKEDFGQIIAVKQRDFLKAAGKSEGESGKELFNTILNKQKGIGQILDKDQLVQLFEGDANQQNAVQEKLKELYSDEDERAIALNALTVDYLRRKNNAATDIRNKILEDKEKQAADEAKQAEEARKAQDRESMLGGIGFGAETTKMDIAGLENRLKEINQLNTKVMGDGPMSAKGIEKTITEMRTALSEINWTIIAEDKVEGVTKSLDSMRMLRGTLFLMEGLGDSAIRAANALRAFGKTDQKGTPAYILFNSADNLSNVVTKIGSAFTGIATITADWKTNFLSMSLEDVRNQVKDLATDAMAISQSINNYSTAILVANTDQMHQASKMLVSNLEDFRESVQNVLDESNAKVKVSVDPLDPSSGTGTYFIHTTPLNVNIQVDVKMEAGNLEQMIISGNSAIVAGFKDVAALGPKAAIVTKLGNKLEVTPSS